MWIIDQAGQAPTIISNNADDQIAEYLRRDFPDGTIYRCVSPGSFATTAAHVNATRSVPHTETIPGVDGGDDTVINTTVLESLGNTIAMDGSELILRDADGATVTTLALDLVP